MSCRRASIAPWSMSLLMRCSFSQRSFSSNNKEYFCYKPTISSFSLQQSPYICRNSCTSLFKCPMRMSFCSFSAAVKCAAFAAAYPYSRYLLYIPPYQYQKLFISQSTMTQVQRRSKANRFNKWLQEEAVVGDKSTWPVQSVVYIGHLPYGFQEEQLRGYFQQYGEVLGVKLARSRRTARSKGYAFVQFAVAEVANIVAQAMQGYFLCGKLLQAHVLPPHARNPFHFASHQYKFIDWRRMHMLHKNKEKTAQEVGKDMANLLRNEEAKRNKLVEMGIQYQFLGFAALLASKK